MGSRKGSAKRRQRERFEAELEDLGEVFERAQERSRALDAHRERAYRNKACDSKRRYATHDEAKDMLVTLELHGRRGLTCYRCPYCKGWHLTSHAQ